MIAVSVFAGVVFLVLTVITALEGSKAFAWTGAFAVALFGITGIGVSSFAEGKRALADELCESAGYETAVFHDDQWQCSTTSFAPIPLVKQEPK